jgi:hypothetical protein
MALPPVLALARTIAARFAADSEFWAGSSLNLTTSPAATATARGVELTDQISATAWAFGLGTGNSKYYTDSDNQDYFNSPNLSIYSGGGIIDGTALAKAFATGRGDTNANAQAINVGLANVAYLARFDGALQIGTSGNRLRASATAGTGSLLDPLSTIPTPSTTLNAEATVRGLEGNGADITPIFYGQPNAAVLADATLSFDTWALPTYATATADAKGLDGYTVQAVPGGNGNGKASISGDAIGRLAVQGKPNKSTIEKLELSGNAIGIDNSRIYGAPALDTDIFGRGLAYFDSSGSDLTPNVVQLNSLQGIGIRQSEVKTSAGNDSVIGYGGYADRGFSKGTPGTRDAAGIDKSIINTGQGNDTVYGAILTEADTGLDSNNDGIISADVFLDGGAEGYDGIRNSTVNTGLGNDGIYGYSNKSEFDGSLGNDVIALIKSKNSTLAGGLGNDQISVDNVGFENKLLGGFGNDNLSVKSGNNNKLDGGFGQDLSAGGSGRDQFIQSDAGVAYTAASNQSFAERLTDGSFWAGLNNQQKSDLWTTGELDNGNLIVGKIDTISNFKSGSEGDSMEINSSLASITQALWETDTTALLDVIDGQLNVLDGGTNTKLGIVIDTLAEIKSLGMGSPSIAYATDTHQLMFDADGDWKQGSISIATINIDNTNDLKKSNFSFT